MFTTVLFVSLFAISQLNVNTVSGNLGSRQRIQRLKGFDFFDQFQDPLIRKQGKQMWDLRNGQIEMVKKRINNTCNRNKYFTPDFRVKRRRINEVKCLEYIWRIRFYTDDRISVPRCLQFPFVVGGKDAEIEQLPYMGAIGWSGISPGTWIFKCGGVLISSKYVLTVAHCSRVPRTDITVSDPFPKIVRFGAKNLLNENNYGPPPKEVKISKFIVHDKYRAPKNYYDIALIELETELEFVLKIHPACVWTSNSDVTGKATLSGWGVVDTATQRTSAILQIAAVDMIPSKQCNNSLKTKRNRNWSRGLTSHQICAGHAQGGIDSCQGDSGGPLQTRIQMPIDKNKKWQMHYVVGLTSFGHRCGQANTPGVFTRVASFIDWIEAIVWKKKLH